MMPGYQLPCAAHLIGAKIYVAGEQNHIIVRVADALPKELGRWKTCRRQAHARGHLQPASRTGGDT